MGERMDIRLSYKSVPSPTLYLALNLKQVSLAGHAWQARTEARERAVPFSVHLADVLSAGFGTLPFIGAIRNARLPFASFAGLPLVDRDVAVRSDERRLHGCSLSLHALAYPTRAASV
jgi:hypothetical protein